MAQVPEGPGDLEAQIEERLLGRPATMGRREVSREAAVSILSARKLWHALGFQIVDDEEVMFTEADLGALRRVADLVRDNDLDEELGAAFDGSAPAVVALVAARSEERVQEVAVTRVQLDPVEAGALGACGGVHEALDRPRQVLVGRHSH